MAPYAARIAPAVVGFRLTPDRVVAKAKLSQDKPAADYAVCCAAWRTRPTCTETLPWQP